MAVQATGAGIVPAMPVVDSLKQVDVTGGVLGVADREQLRAAQTPQGFPRTELDAAYAAAGSSDYTDDAAVFAAYGGAVTTIPGDEVAFKITTAWDLNRAHQVLGGIPDSHRVGTGLDVHAFGEAENLWLAGLHWPGEKELSGHSDGDAVAHAICDALLSAAGLGDIGSRFGTSDPAYANASGEVFVRGTIELLAAAGFEPINVSVQLIGNKPRFSPRRDEAQSVLTEWVGAPVSVSATTTDGLGFTGRGEGVAAIATALIRQR
jgi:2-C-methyl-D-erythritol 4-phosphate cytidylyltransferase/2-C-methyl-D-erythritol 2,4-cyclodiphosphate synthase